MTTKKELIESGKVINEQEQELLNTNRQRDAGSAFSQIGKGLTSGVLKSSISSLPFAAGVLHGVGGTLGGVAATTMARLSPSLRDYTDDIDTSTLFSTFTENKYFDVANHINDMVDIQVQGEKIALEQKTTLEKVAEGAGYALNVPASTYGITQGLANLSQKAPAGVGLLTSIANPAISGNVTATGQVARMAVGAGLASIVGLDADANDGQISVQTERNNNKLASLATGGLLAATAYGLYKSDKRVLNSIREEATARGQSVEQLMQSLAKRQVTGEEILHRGIDKVKALTLDKDTIIRDYSLQTIPTKPAYQLDRDLAAKLLTKPEQVAYNIQMFGEDIITDKQLRVKPIDFYNKIAELERVGKGASVDSFNEGLTSLAELRHRTRSIIGNILEEKDSILRKINAGEELIKRDSNRLTQLDTYIKQIGGTDDVNNATEYARKLMTQGDVNQQVRTLSRIPLLKDDMIRSSNEYIFRGRQQASNLLESAYSGLFGGDGQPKLTSELLSNINYMKKDPIAMRLATEYGMIMEDLLDIGADMGVLSKQMTKDLTKSATLDGIPMYMPMIKKKEVKGLADVMKTALPSANIGMTKNIETTFGSMLSRTIKTEGGVIDPLNPVEALNSYIEGITKEFMKNYKTNTMIDFNNALLAKGKTVYSFDDMIFPFKLIPEEDLGKATKEKWNTIRTIKDGKEQYYLTSKLLKDYFDAEVDPTNTISTMLQASKKWRQVTMTGIGTFYSFSTGVVRNFQNAYIYGKSYMKGMDREKLNAIDDMLRKYDMLGNRVPPSVLSNVKQLKDEALSLVKQYDEEAAKQMSIGSMAKSFKEYFNAISLENKYKDAIRLVQEEYAKQISDVGEIDPIRGKQIIEGLQYKADLIQEKLMQNQFAYLRRVSNGSFSVDENFTDSLGNKTTVNLDRLVNGLDTYDIALPDGLKPILNIINTLKGTASRVIDSKLGQAFKTAHETVRASTSAAATKALGIKQVEIDLIKKLSDAFDRYSVEELANLDATQLKNFFDEKTIAMIGNLVSGDAMPSARGIPLASNTLGKVFSGATKWIPYFAITNSAIRKSMTSVGLDHQAKAIKHLINSLDVTNDPTTAEMLKKAAFNESMLGGKEALEFFKTAMPFVALAPTLAFVWNISSPERRKQYRNLPIDLTATHIVFVTDDGGSFNIPIEQTFFNYHNLVNSMLYGEFAEFFTDDKMLNNTTLDDLADRTAIMLQQAMGLVNPLPLDLLGDITNKRIQSNPHSIYETFATRGRQGIITDTNTMMGTQNRMLQRNNRANSVLDQRTYNVLNTIFGNLGRHIINGFDEATVHWFNENKIDLSNPEYNPILEGVFDGIGGAAASMRRSRKFYTTPEDNIRSYNTLNKQLQTARDMLRHGNRAKNNLLHPLVQDANSMERVEGAMQFVKDPLERFIGYSLIDDFAKLPLVDKKYIEIYGEPPPEIDTPTRFKLTTAVKTVQAIADAQALLKNKAKHIAGTPIVHTPIYNNKTRFTHLYGEVSKTPIDLTKVDVPLPVDKVSVKSIQEQAMNKNKGFKSIMDNTILFDSVPNIFNEEIKYDKGTILDRYDRTSTVREINEQIQDLVRRERDGYDVINQLLNEIADNNYLDLDINIMRMFEQFN